MGDFFRMQHRTGDPLYSPNKKNFVKTDSRQMTTQKAKKKVGPGPQRNLICGPANKFHRPSPRHPTERTAKSSQIKNLVFFPEYPLPGGQKKGGEVFE